MPHNREGERRAVALGVGCPVAGVRVWLRTVALRARLQIRLKLRVELAHIVPQPRVVRQIARAKPHGERARQLCRRLQMRRQPVPLTCTVRGMGVKHGAIVPHPPVGAGATSVTPSNAVLASWFQSSLARGGGCNAMAELADAPHTQVSILTRPWGRVQRTLALTARGHLWSFNPHPPVGAGATRSAWDAGTATRCFNPHPPVGTGATHSVQRRHYNRAASFNPHPPVGAGATRECVAVPYPLSLVPILTRPWGRVQPVDRLRRSRRCLFQSSPARGGGCNGRPLAFALQLLAFQSSPARGGGCNAHPIGINFRAAQTEGTLNVL
jgi:hypothetical protein